jgi:HK97 family phage major capsid protein
VTTTTTGSKIMVVGDFTNFLVLDRIGMQVELVPHLVGANHRPTGQRGLYAFWRNTSGVLVPNAFRYLEVK